MKVPVAFIIFNRPEVTRRVFQRIRAFRPTQLLVVADGPRSTRPGEADRCLAAREIVARGVDWPCEVLMNSVEENLGCRQRVASGLNWVFNQVDEAIILEDDCLPHPNFFAYCEELLARYRDDERVFSISGDNFLSEVDSGVDSYRFSRIPHIWGWATWRRAWRHYDVEMNGWPKFRRRGGIKQCFPAHPAMQRVWTNFLDSVYQGKVDTWDFQWCFASFARDGMHILPRRNLVTNLGFASDATHTTVADAVQANLPVYPADQPLRHPRYVEINPHADHQTFRLTIGAGQPSMAVRVWIWMRTIAGHALRWFEPASIKPQKE